MTTDPTPSSRPSRSRSPRSPRRVLWWVLGTLLSLTVYSAASLSAGDGEPVPPLDDTYIHLQYARNLANGEFFRFFPGGGYSTGDTSPLYVLCLVPAFWLGLDGCDALFWVFAINALLLLAAIGLTMRLVGTSIDSRLAQWTILLLMLTWGPWLWGVFGGMEVALAAVLLLIVAVGQGDPSVKRRGRVARWVALACLPLVRPEGAIWSGCAIAAAALMQGRPWRSRVARLVAESLLLVPFGLYMVLNRCLTGSFETAGYLVKGAAASPDLGLTGMAGHVATWVERLFSNLFLSSSAEYLPPFAAIWMIAVLGPKIREEWKSGRAGWGTLVSIWWLAGLIAVGLAWFPDVHRLRYLLPFFPLFLVVFALGVGRGQRWASQRAGLSILGLVVLATLLVSNPIRWIDRYASDASEIARVQVRMAHWIDHHLDEDAIIGLHDAGALVYLTKQPVVDFVGLGSPEFAIPFRHGDGSVYEALERLPPDERPDFYVTSPRWFQAPVLGREVAQAAIARAAILPSASFSLYQANDEEMSTGPSYPLRQNGLGEALLVDEVDVADVVSESEHFYRNRVVDRSVQHTNVAERFVTPDGRGVVDGGRLIFVEERFTINLEPDQPFALFMRMRSVQSQPLHIQIHLSDGQEHWVTLEHGASSGELATWFDPLEETRIQVRVRHMNGTPFYSFHYWVFQ